MGFVIWKIFDQLNVWLFNVKQGFCLSRKLLLFGVVAIFLTFSSFEDFSVVSIIIQDMVNNNSRHLFTQHCGSVLFQLQKYDDSIHEMRTAL